MALAWIALAVVFAIAYSSIPTSPATKARQIEGPTVEEGRPIIVLFGMREIDSPNIVYYGDIRVEAIRQSGGKK